MSKQDTFLNQSPVYDTMQQPHTIQNATNEVHTPINAQNDDFIERVNVQPEEPTHQPPTAPGTMTYEKGPDPSYVVPLQSLGESPAMIACPHCKHRAMTRVSKEDSSMTTICGVVLCLICICAACLPCVCGWFQDIDHYCTNCGKKVIHQRHDGGNEIIYPVGPEPTTTIYPNAIPKPANVHQKG